MCVIIYLPINTKIDKDELLDAFSYNDDGAGIAWVEDGKVHYSKGYTKFDDFYKNTKSIIDNDSIERVIHFRITSRGTTNPFQTHPFQYTDDAEKTKILDYIGVNPVLFANGTITNQKLINGLNDTASFIINDLYNSSLSFDNDIDLKIIDKLTNCKWAIVETTGVKLVGDFTLDDGVYYSNLYHRLYGNIDYKSFFTSYDKDKKDDKLDDYELSYDDCFYDDYSLVDLIDDCDAPLLNDDTFDKCKNCTSGCTSCTCNDCGYADTVSSYLDDEPCLSDANISNVNYFQSKKSKTVYDLDDYVTNGKFKDWVNANFKSLKTLCGLD